jgi:fructosamine-3-kinase
MWARTAATAHSDVERHPANYSWSRKIARAQGWPNCDPACWRGEREVDPALSHI